MPDRAERRITLSVEFHRADAVIDLIREGFAVLTDLQQDRADTTDRKIHEDISHLTRAINRLREDIAVMSDALQSELDTLTANVAALTTAEESASTMLNGLQASIDAAVAAALAAGATAAQLESFSNLNTALAAKTQSLANAVAANTKPVPEPEPEPMPDPVPEPDPAP